MQFKDYTENEPQSDTSQKVWPYYRKGTDMRTKH